MKNHTLAFLLASAALTCTLGAQAQMIYRIVGADGKVTFSDKPPVSSEQGKIAGTGVGASGAAANAALPFELRQIVAKYPVTLYTAPKCAPCDSGRALLSARGVPFSERTVITPEDSDYLQRLVGDNTLPYVSIGSQRIKGFSDGEWTQYLDAAGYPKTSLLPTTYKNAAPTPLVTVQKPAPKADSKPQPPAETAPAPGPSPSNPAGITF